jgi:hypothetical protein
MKILKDVSPNTAVRRSNRARTVKVMRDESSSEEDVEAQENAFMKASTPKDLKVEENDTLSEITTLSKDDDLNELSSIIKRKPPSEYDFASSPPALVKKVRY